MQAGRDYLALYAGALKAAERASPSNIHDRGVEANAAFEAIEQARIEAVGANALGGVRANLTAALEDTGGNPSTGCG